MASKVEIINRSLTLLGSQPIVSLSDNTQQARIANRLYPTTLKAVLSATLWTFATARVLLAQLSETPAWVTPLDNLSIVYQIPTDVIRIFGINDDSHAIKWKREQDKILADSEGLGIKYVFYNDDPTTYTESFVEALADKLASDMAYPLLNSVPKKKDMLESYKTISLPEAKAENAQVGRPDVLQDDFWALAKYNGASLEEV